MRLLPTKLTSTALALGVVAIAGLASQPAHAMNWKFWNHDNQPVSTDHAFRTYLGERYQLLSLDEDQGLDIEDSEYLRGAQVDALSGAPIVPHPLDKVRIVSSAPGELERGRALLVNAGNNGAVEKMPGVYARALSSFDCWVEQQEAEPNASHNTQSCRAMFMREASKLESLNTAQTTEVKMVVVENLRTLHSVHFAFDKYDLSSDAKAKLDQAHDMLTNTDNGKLIIRGFADASGPAGYNQALSKKRADAVASYLNLPADRFETRVVGYGETNLHVPTKDGVREAANRVVDISVNANKVDVKTTTETQQ